MKIRWTGDNVRFRITPQELDALIRGENVLESLGLAETGWTASLIPGGACSELHVEGGALRCRLSAQDLAHLSEPESEGVYLTNPGTPPVRFMVEKDFPCIHPRGANAQEPPGETFAPPPDFEARKA